MCFKEETMNLGGGNDIIIFSFNFLKIMNATFLWHLLLN